MKFHLTHTLILLASLVGFATRNASADEVVRAKSAVVIAGHPEAVKLGLKVIDAGGTAADALVTVSLSLGVVEPGNSGMGGKLCLTYYDATTKKVSSLVALDASPASVDVDRISAMTSDQRKRGWQAACVPGLVAALSEIHEKFGKKDWATLVTPAADLAAKGFVVDERVEKMLEEFPPDVDPESKRIYAPQGHTTKAGERFQNTDLAESLKLIARDGAKAFYNGPIAEKIVSASTKAGWPMSTEDFQSYRARWLEPLSGQFNGYTFYTSPPPVSGGSILLTSLACLSTKDWKGVQPRDVEYIDTVARVMQQVYPAVNNAAADIPDSRQRVNELLARDSITKLRVAALQANVQDPFASAQQPRAMLDRDDLEMSLDDSQTASTTHITIIDRAGNIVCATQSLGNHFGSGVMAPGTGILLNNCINNFSFTKKSINYIGPRKFPRSTMTPTIVLRDGKPYLVIGSPAGQRIPSTVLQVSLDVLQFKRPLDDAIEVPRYHLVRPASKTEPVNQIDLEIGNTQALADALTAKGWKTKLRTNKGDYYFGCVNAAIFQSDGSIIGVADQRRSGDAAGD